MFTLRLSDQNFEVIPRGILIFSVLVKNLKHQTVQYKIDQRFSLRINTQRLVQQIQLTRENIASSFHLSKSIESMKHSNTAPSPMQSNFGSFEFYYVDHSIFGSTYIPIYKCPPSSANK
ncbi:hypothetical protein DC094_11150 [Pelagibaculum spongiae]|uniref:Uncharacterized protein n=1 Tax=Pelagibaculum spongiae TaxID=2080658 RepID=A0A2V1GVY0_9GAMM|nr:hypothetical protein DC094_11150 [Pelagibaculum spongiae]